MIHYVKKVSLTENIPDNLNEIIFGAGCFWGVEKKFWDIPGIYLTSVGYSGSRRSAAMMRHISPNFVAIISIQLPATHASVYKARTA